MKLIKAFLGIFSVASNFNKEKREYENSGYFVKILSIFIHLLMIALVAGCAYGAYWCITGIDFLSVESIFVVNLLRIAGAIFCIFTGFSVAFKTFVSCLQKTIIAFNSARKPRKQKKKNQLGQTISANASSLGEELLVSHKGANIEELQSIQQEHIDEQPETYANQAPKTSKGFDIFYGFVTLLLTIALPTGLAILFTVVL